MLTKLEPTPGWVLLQVAGRADVLNFEFCSEAGKRQRITVRTPGVGGDAICGTRVSARLSAPEQLEAAEHAALLSLAGGLAQEIEDALDAEDAPLTSLLFYGPKAGTEMELSPQSLLELLGPELTLTAPAPFGWRLKGVVPSSRATAAMQLALELNFEHDTGSTLRVEIAAKSAARSFAQTSHFSISYLTNRGEVPAQAELLVTWLATHLSLRDGPNLRVHFPEANALAPTTHQLPVVRGSSEWLNLAIDAECGQACTFCSVKDLSPAWASHELPTTALLRDLENAAAQGIRKLRLNGYDPLALDGILDLAQSITRLGFREVALYSPCTRLEDAGFAQQLFAALPETEVFVPLYAAAAAVHDRVTGTSGSHARVLRALDVLGTLPSVRVTLSSVAVRGNLGGLQQLQDFATRRGLRLRIATPYPSSELPTDRFGECAASFSEIAKSTITTDAAVFVDGLPACVTSRRLAQGGHGLDAFLAHSAQMRGLPGREYTEGAYSHSEAAEQHDAFVASAVACPHVADCALSAHCPREVLRAYADKFGLEELAAVSLRELLSMGSEAPAD